MFLILHEGINQLISNELILPSIILCPKYARPRQLAASFSLLAVILRKNMQSYLGLDNDYY